MKKSIRRKIIGTVIDYAGVSLIFGIISGLISPRPIVEVLLVSAGIVAGERLLGIAYDTWMRKKVNHEDIR